MNLNGETIIAAKPDAVWRALNDPEILRQAIPGCETLEKTSDTAFKATVALKIGPMQTRFNGAVTLADMDPPNGYTISGSGSGGVAGNARGSAKVRLEPHGEGTKLIYDVDAQVAGKLAQLGSRLIDSTAKMLAGQFFERFGALVAGPVAGVADAAIEEGATPSRWLWIGLAAAIGLVAGYLLFR